MLDPLAGLPPRVLRTPEAARFLGLSGRTLAVTNDHPCNDPGLSAHLAIRAVAYRDACGNRSAVPSRAHATNLTVGWQRGALERADHNGGGRLR